MRKFVYFCLLIHNRLFRGGEGLLIDVMVPNPFEDFVSTRG